VKRNAARSEKAAGSRPHGRAMRSAVLGGGVTLHGSCSAAARGADEKMSIDDRRLQNVMLRPILYILG
jgi:hypothetical protein